MLKKALEKRGREAAEEAQARGLELEESESSESGYAGVSATRGGGWQAKSSRASNDGSRAHLGMYATREEAAVAVADHQAARLPPHARPFPPRCTKISPPSAGYTDLAPAHKIGRDLTSRSLSRESSGDEISLEEMRVAEIHRC